MQKSSGLHNKYRPDSLDSVVGSSRAVSVLKGYIERGEFPSAIMFLGPPSSGKTTLARAFASDVLGMQADTSPNMEETNLSDSRSIDDIRGLISTARLRPLNGPRRFIYCDEAHGVLSNNPAANALLKPLEEPTRTTTWILSSMEPEKFSGTTIGKAILSRCVPLKLKAPTDEDLFEQAKRIAVGEKIHKIIGKARLLQLVENSDKTYRGVAAQLEVFSSMRDDPDAAFEEAMTMGVAYQDSPEEELVSLFVQQVFNADPNGAIRTLFKIKDGVGLVMKLGYYSWFFLGLSSHNGKPPPGVWGSKAMWGAWKSVKSSEHSSAIHCSLFHQKVVQLRLQAGAFSVSGQQAAVALAYLFKS